MAVVSFYHDSALVACNLVLWCARRSASVALSATLPGHGLCLIFCVALYLWIFMKHVLRTVLYAANGYEWAFLLCIIISVEE